MQAYKEKVMGVIEEMIKKADEAEVIAFLQGVVKGTLKSVLYHIKEIPDDNGLYEAQKEYIEFLENYVNSVSGYLSVHGMRSSKEDIEKGESLRKRISELSPPPTPNQE